MNFIIQLLAIINNLNELDLQKKYLVEHDIWNGSIGGSYTSIREGNKQNIILWR